MKLQYTLKEGSAKLIESGLDPETADGWVNVSNGFETKFGQWSVAKSWSAGQLLELLPPSIVVGGDEYLLKCGKSYIPTDNGKVVEEWVAYNCNYAKLAGDYVGFSTITNKCTFLDCLVDMVCWVCENTVKTPTSGINVMKKEVGL